ncbi:hypothetical protein QBC37DRAFT_405205 [Rhypophila decipiens]|uniref:Oleosin n=1 Tax=Rhypophila decipiens TaxID=261697 RepID=A0AAN7B3E5_9PEZI|nr:hypothetical protein QBC37DRAFT_405205 [Rhypophila decipiens]
MFADILGAMAAFSIISCGVPVMLATVIAIPLGIAMILVTITSIMAAVVVMMPIFILGGLISATAVCLGTAMLFCGHRSQCLGKPQSHASRVSVLEVDIGSSRIKGDKNGKL